MFKKSSILIILLFCLISSGIFVSQVNAAGFDAKRYPTVSGVELTSKSNFIDYISYIYIFGISLLGIIAVGALIYGGIMYMLSGTVTSTEEARKYIWGALSGLILAFGSYIILNSINPDLVNFKIGIEPVPAESTQ